MCKCEQGLETFCGKKLELDGTELHKLVEHSIRLVDLTTQVLLVVQVDINAWGGGLVFVYWTRFQNHTKCYFRNQGGLVQQDDYSNKRGV